MPSPDHTATAMARTYEEASLNDFLHHIASAATHPTTHSDWTKPYREAARLSWVKGILTAHPEYLQQSGEIKYQWVKSSSVEKAQKTVTNEQGQHQITHDIIVTPKETETLHLKGMPIEVAIKLGDQTVIELIRSATPTRHLSESATRERYYALQCGIHSQSFKQLSSNTRNAAKKQPAPQQEPPLHRIKTLSR